MEYKAEKKESEALEQKLKTSAEAAEKKKLQEEEKQRKIEYTEQKREDKRQEHMSNTTLKLENSKTLVQQKNDMNYILDQMPDEHCDSLLETISVIIFVIGGSGNSGSNISDSGTKYSGIVLHMAAAATIIWKIKSGGEGKGGQAFSSGKNTKIQIQC